MSLVSYNGINLPYPFTTKFSQDPIYDEVGGVDWCATRYDIQVQCVINLEYLNSMSNLFGTVTSGNAASVMNRIRTYLLQPRNTLAFYCNGVNLIPAKAGVPGTVDVRNGPQPKTCGIVNLSNDTFILNYHIIAHYWENYSTPDSVTNNRPSNPVMYNRWTETVEIDNCLYTTRTRSGKYIIRSDNVEGKIADELRLNMAVVGVPNGFLRQSSQYTQSPDGLGIQYRVVDKETYKMPPEQAYEAQGQQILIGTKPGAAVNYSECRLRLKGCKSNKFSPQNKLVEAAILIVAEKLDLVGSSVLQYGSVATSMYDNVVEVYMKALCNSGIFTYSGLNLAESLVANLCITPGSEGIGKTPVYLPRGTASLLLQAASYYDPNLRGNKLGAGEVALAGNNQVPNSTNSQMILGEEIGRAGLFPE